MVGFISIECLRTKAKKGSDNFREFRASHHLSPHHPRRHAALRPQSHRHQWFWIAIARHLNIISLIASVVLTLAINLLPALFPKAAEKAERKILEGVQKTHENRVDPNTPKVRIFFPWKAMLLISIGLTVAVNLIGFFVR